MLHPAYHQAAAVFWHLGGIWLAWSLGETVLFVEAAVWRWNSSCIPQAHWGVHSHHRRPVRSLKWVPGPPKRKHEYSFVRVWSFPGLLGRVFQLLTDDGVSITLTSSGEGWAWVTAYCCRLAVLDVFSTLWRQTDRQTQMGPFTVLFKEGNAHIFTAGSCFIIGSKTKHPPLQKLHIISYLSTKLLRMFPAFKSAENSVQVCGTSRCTRGQGSLWLTDNLSGGMENYPSAVILFWCLFCSSTRVPATEQPIRASQVWRCQIFRQNKRHSSRAKHTCSPAGLTDRDYAQVLSAYNYKQLANSRAWLNRNCFITSN